MPEIPFRDAKLARLIHKKSTTEASDKIRPAHFQDPNHDIPAIKALNSLLGTGELIINPQGQIDIPNNPSQSPTKSE